MTGSLRHSSCKTHTKCSTCAVLRCMADLLDVRDLRMRYGKTDVLNGVGFAARRGEVLALLGPNGAGKTTTIEILEGFRVRSAGEVSVLAPIPRTAARRGGRGPASCCSPGVTTRNNRSASCSRTWAATTAVLHGRHPAPLDVDDLLETVGLTPHARKRVRNLSGGQRRPSTWRSASWGGPSCCSSTSRRQASTRRPDVTSMTSCTGSATGRRPRSCSPRTTWTRRNGSRIAS